MTWSCPLFFYIILLPSAQICLHSHNLPVCSYFGLLLLWGAESRCWISPGRLRARLNLNLFSTSVTQNWLELVQSQPTKIHPVTRQLPPQVYSPTPTFILSYLTSSHCKNGVCQVQIHQMGGITDTANSTSGTDGTEVSYTWSRQHRTAGRGTDPSLMLAGLPTQMDLLRVKSTTSKSTSDSTHSQLQSLQDSIFFFFSGDGKYSFITQNNKTP